MSRVDAAAIRAAFRERGFIADEAFGTALQLALALAISRADFFTDPADLRTKPVAQLLEGATLELDFLNEHRHGGPQRIGIAAPVQSGALIPILRSQRRENLRVDAAWWIRGGQRAVQPLLEATQDLVPRHLLRPES